MRDAAKQLGIYEGQKAFMDVFMGVIGVIPGGDTFADANSLAQDLGDGNYKGATFTAAMLLVPGVSASTVKGGLKLLPQLSASTIENILKAGQQLDKGGQLSKAGRALQKHGSRPGSAFPAATGNPMAMNAQGQAILNGIISSSSQTIKPNRFGGQDIFDNVTGRGVRIDGSGAMMGFLEP